jgi:hypothetical protein
MSFRLFTEESVSSWESSDDGYAGNDEAHGAMLKNSNKENKYGGECIVLQTTVAGTLNS